MKKIFAIVLAMMLLCSAAMAEVLTHADYIAAELDSEVTIETYVQATQGWWSDNGKGKISV